MSLVYLLAAAGPQGSSSSSGNPLMTLLPFALVFLVLWFVMIRPQKKQQDQRKAMIAALKRGDEIVTNGGLFATVKDVKSDRVVATIAEGVKVQISKSAIGGVTTEEK